MELRIATRFCLALAIIAAATTATAGQDKSKRTQVQDLIWFETPFGPMASPVLGDFASGQHITYIKFSAGMTTPVHAHSEAYTGMVITGVTRHYEPGRPETEVELPAGSHWYIPANLPHVSECLPGAECVMAPFQSGPMDFFPTN